MCIRDRYNPDWVRYGAWDRDSGYEMAKPLIDAGVTAIFCMADRMAGGVYDYLEECGLKAVSYTHLRAHENRHDLVCRLLLEKKKHYTTVNQKSQRHIEKTEAQTTGQETKI